MTAPELHADDLLDREIRGLLTPDERTRLESHLAVCSVCRFERTVRADFRAEFAALGAGNRGDSDTNGKFPAPLVRGRFVRRARARLLAMVAVAVLLAGVAGAELSGRGFFATFLRAPGPSGARATAASAKEGTARLSGKRNPRPDADPPPVARDEAAEPADLSVASAEPSATAVPLATAETSAASPARATPAAPAAPPVSAATLFDEARDAREHGDYALAIERYTHLLRAFPASPQAPTSHALLGRLLLDRADPGAALTHFDAYLASGATSLTEEALLGRALAFGKLGRAVQEAGAWQALLRAYPTSLHASRARERLSALAAE